MPSPSTALLRTQTDERLLVLAKAGHERAFEAIVHRYRRPLLWHCRRVLPEARAEDALQQALLAAWTGLRRGDEVRELRPWLYRIAHNSALNALRVSGYDYDELAESVRVVDAPEDELERRAVVRQTLAGIAALPEVQRQALLRTVIEGTSQEDIAEELGLSHGAVRQLVHRARVSLRTAATAVVPLPLADWLAGIGGGPGAPLTARVAELAAGSAAGAGAGVGGTLAKGGAVAVVAAGAVSGPAIVEKVEQRERSERVAVSAPARTPGAPTPAPSPFSVARAGTVAARTGAGGSAAADPTATPGAGGRAAADPTATPGAGGRGGGEPTSFAARPFDDSGSSVPEEGDAPAPAPAATQPGDGFDDSGSAGSEVPASAPAPAAEPPRAPAPAPDPSPPPERREERPASPPPDPTPSAPARPDPTPEPTPAPTPDPPPQSGEQTTDPTPTPTPTADPTPQGSEQTTGGGGGGSGGGKDPKGPDSTPTPTAPGGFDLPELPVVDLP